MRYRREDDDGDYTFGQGDDTWLVNSPEAVAQAIKTRFLLWYGDWMNGQTPNTLTLNRKTGEPREFYRGVASNHFKAFNDGKGRSFFTDSRKMAETYGSKVYPVYAATS